MEWFSPDKRWAESTLLTVTLMIGLGIFFVAEHESESEVVQSCLTLFDPMDYSLPGSSIHGIVQARILDWVTISSSRRSS